MIFDIHPALPAVNRRVKRVKLLSSSATVFCSATLATEITAALLTALFSVDLSFPCQGSTRKVKIADSK